MNERQRQRIRAHHDAQSPRLVLAGRLTIRGGKVTAMLVKGAICKR